MKILSSKQILELIQKSIANWHMENAACSQERIIVTDEIRKIRPLNVHRDDLGQVVKELTLTNTKMWHEEDKVRSENDAVVLKAIRNINPLNQHRNDLIEEIDEIVLDNVAKA